VPRANGTVEGIAWFDRNDNGRQDAGEWPLPGVHVELVATPTTNSSRAVRATTRAVKAFVRDTVTGAAGQYRFSNVAPGNYRVTASADKAGFDYTYDTDGSADWSVVVGLAAGATAAALFAGLGKGTVEGKVYTSTDGTPISNAEVSCRWAGFDDVLGTADDVAITTTADAGGQFDLEQVPYGQFSCVGQDPVTGATSTEANVWVLSAAPVHPQLPVTPAKATPAPDPHQPTVVNLANTGVVPTRSLLTLAISLLLAGLAALVLGRRRHG